MKQTMRQKRFWASFWEDWLTTLKGGNLKFEFQMQILQLLAYNFLITGLVAKQDFEYDFSFKDAEMSRRFGVEMDIPTITLPFSFWFRLNTVLMSTFVIIPFFKPIRKCGTFLLPCILWSFFLMVAIAVNLLQTLWTIYILKVSVSVFITISLAALFMLSLHAKLTLQVICFYEYLYYTEYAE